MVSFQSCLRTQCPRMEPWGFHLRISPNRPFFFAGLVRCARKPLSTARDAKNRKQVVGALHSISHGHSCRLCRKNLHRQGGACGPSALVPGSRTTGPCQSADLDSVAESATLEPASGSQGKEQF